MKKNRKHSLFKKLIIPLIFVTVCQSLFFFLATFYGGISETINKNAENVLKERVINQEKTLETMFNTQWTNFSTTKDSVLQSYNDIKKESGKEIFNDVDLQKKVLSESADSLVKMIRATETNGVFLILNNEKEYSDLQSDESKSYYGVCIRDYSPTSEYTDKEDLLTLRCPSSMMTSVGCPVEGGWDALYTFSEETPGDYFYKPLKLGYENPTTETSDLAYFDTVHNFGGTDRMVVSYSVPLVDEDGYPFGVLGIELTVDYLKSLLPASTLYGSNAGCYSLVEYEEGTNEYQILAYNGALFQQCFGTNTSFEIKKVSNDMIQPISENREITLTGYGGEIQIYNHNTPFENHKLALVGTVKQDSLYSINALVRKRLVVVSVVVMLIGSLAILFISRRLTNPINKLSNKVRHMESNSDVQLERLNIDEIDDLVESIEELNDKVNRTAIRAEFFSRMSHDMRTPMNAIIGFSSKELLEDADQVQLKEYMEKINSSGTYLLTLINEVLDMAKIETQRMELREEIIMEDGMLTSITPIIEEVALKKNVTFTVESDHADTPFYCDHQHMSQVLMNLLSNAVKFTEPGGIVLLKIQELGQADGKVTHRIIVRDNGCGMSEKFQERMYEPFSQEGRKEGGTGLGLAIARQIILLMGGSMDCSSVEGEGTTFIIEVSSKIADKLPERVVENNNVCGEKTKISKNLAGKHILVCEDHPMNAQIAKRLLERVGIIVDIAVNGQDGVQAFAQSDTHTFDAVLMDIRMPIMNGLEATRAIRALDREDARTIPIIAMTANAFKEDVEQSEKAGMNMHLSKPIDPKILYLALEKYL